MFNHLSCSMFSFLSQQFKISSSFKFCFNKLHSLIKSNQLYWKCHFNFRFASLTTLHQVYNEQICWQNYKLQLKKLHEDSRSGGPVAMRPATAKGSTGWVKWPGLMVEDFKARACKLHPDGWSCCCPPREKAKERISVDYSSAIIPEIRVPGHVAWGPTTEKLYVHDSWNLW